MTLINGYWRCSVGDSDNNLGWQPISTVPINEDVIIWDKMFSEAKLMILNEWRKENLDPDFTHWCYPPT